MGRQKDRKKRRKKEKADGGEGEKQWEKKREGDEKVGGMRAREVEMERKKR